MRAAAGLLLAALVFGAWGSCHGESNMTLFDQRWNEMKASPSGAVEAERLEGLVEFARSRGLKYTVSLVDAASQDLFASPRSPLWSATAHTW